MTVDPEVLRALERTLVADPDNRALRLHLVDLLLADAQFAAALGHCETLLRGNPGDEDAARLAGVARSNLGVTPTPERESAVPVSELFDIARPEVSLADVAGMEEVKQRLRSSFLEPLRNEELRRSFGQSLRSGLLLWGPPGCGKTFIARALAGELGLYFLHVGIADILDVWTGSSERNMRQIFAEARDAAPAVLFFDELDALGHKRGRLHSASSRNVVNQLLVELDGVHSDNEGLLILGATNQPWDIDAALLRPGRFDREILVLPPDEPARRAIVEFQLRRSPVGDIDPDAIARRTDGFSGADIAQVCRRAVEFALDDSVRAGTTCPVEQRHLDAALADTGSTTQSWLKTADNYVKFADDAHRYRELAKYMNRRRR